jgi:hypothetical protein
LTSFAKTMRGFAKMSENGTTRFFSREYLICICQNIAVLLAILLIFLPLSVINHEYEEKRYRNHGAGGQF